jgi:hypothetical protein
VKEHHLAYVALCLTAGEFGASFWLLIHEGHILALYLAVTYLSRETSGGKHYHDIVVRWLEKARLQKAADEACARMNPVHPVLHNPFGSKRRGKV